MFRTHPRVVAGATAAVAATAAALAVAGPAPAAARHAHQPAPVVVEARTLAETLVDVGAPGLSPGDQQVLTEDLYRAGRRLGEDHVVCSIVRVGPGGFTAQCVSTASLPGGEITSQGLVTSAQIETSPFVQAITGGTGRYAGARGELTVDEAGPQPAKLTFALRRR